MKPILLTFSVLLMLVVAGQNTNKKTASKNSGTNAKQISAKELQDYPIKQIEESIKDFGLAIQNAIDMVDRFRADSLFTRGLVQALRMPYS
jgi:endonuclease III